MNGSSISFGMLKVAEARCWEGEPFSAVKKKLEEKAVQVEQTPTANCGGYNNFNIISSPENESIIEGVLKKLGINVKQSTAPEFPPSLKPESSYSTEKALTELDTLA